MKIVNSIMEAIDDNVTDALCTGCEWRDHFPATRYCPEEWVCPANFDPSDSSCGKHREYLRLKGMARKIEEELEQWLKS